MKGTYKSLLHDNKATEPLLIQNNGKNKSTLNNASYLQSTQYIIKIFEGSLVKILHMCVQ